MIYYPDPGSAEAANTLAGLLGNPSTEADSTVPSGHLRIVLGADFTMPATLGSAGGAGALPTALPALPIPAVSPDGDTARMGDNSISTGGIPCVK
jgi:hypothetical protein